MKIVATLSLTLALLAGCATGSTTQALLGSGATLKAVGAQWNAVNAAFVDACKPSAPKLPTTDCTQARAFDDKMRKAYPLALQLFETAVNAQDVAMAADAKSVIRSLSVDMVRFGLQVGITLQEVK